MSQDGGKNNAADGREGTKMYLDSLKVSDYMKSILQWTTQEYTGKSLFLLLFLFFWFNSLMHTLFSGACQLKEANIEVGVEPSRKNSEIML